MRVRMQRYGASTGGRALAREAGVRMLRHTNSTFRGRPSDVILNWGSSTVLHPRSQYINHPTAVANAADKLRTFELLASDGVPIPEWTTSREEALRWLIRGDRVIHRTLTRGSQGRGCTVYSTEGTEWSAPGEQLGTGGFYVKVFGDVLHNEEFRVHVWDGEVIDVVQKRRRRDYEQRINPYIRSYSNGWVFCRNTMSRPREVLLDAAVRAVESLGLDFGAVDCAQSREGGACVYEVNTAPGIEGTTLERYGSSVRRACSRHSQ